MQNQRSDEGVEIAESPYVFMTNVNGETIKCQAPGDVMVTKDGVVENDVSECRWMYNQSYLQATDACKKIDALYDALDDLMRKYCESRAHYECNKVSFNMLLRSREAIEASLLSGSVKFAISVTHKTLNDYRFSYLKDDGTVSHTLIKCQDVEKIFRMVEQRGWWNQPDVNSFEGYMLHGVDSDDLIDSQDSPPISPGRDGVFGATMPRVTPQADHSNHDEKEKSSAVIKRLGGKK